MSKHPRRVFFIRPEIQFRWGLFVGNLGLFGCLFTTAVIFVTPALIESVSQTRTIATTQVVELLQQIWPWLLLTTILYFLATFTMGILFCHRIVGPIYRLEKLLKERSCGQPSGRINLRDGDQLVDFVNLVTDHVDRWAEIEKAAAVIVKDASEKNVESLRRAMQQAFTPHQKIED